MEAKSLWPVLTSSKDGQVDPERWYVITGRERHVDSAREGNKPYPQRALRTKDFLYIRNFAPDRSPFGDPKQVTDDQAPNASELETNTFAAFPDLDAGPTKAWLIQHRHEPEGKRFYDIAFGKRPGDELYDLRTDPDEVHNVAGERMYEATRQQLAKQLQQILTQAGDPRFVEADCRFEKPPFAGAKY